ncbi:MAG: Glycerate dehydrogenase [Steroidobacteraceae bacterium]|nr:Glycerate dehydrogenase [Steroidobacteraceae bacterium]
MKSAFLDYATVSAGDLDSTALERACPALTLYDETPPERIAARIADVGLLLVNKARITRELMEGAPSLRLIALAATGTDNVDLDAARERNVAVCNIRDYCTPSVVQHVLGAILALTHRFADYSRRVKAGDWGARAQFTMLDYPIRELAGRTLGVVGYGTLGRAVATACETALGMKVRVAQRAGGTDPAHPPGPPAIGVARLPLDALLREADVLTLHCPLTPATRGLIGPAQLALMKPDAIVINTARGALIDVAALAQALREGRLGGAAIDVLAQEPPVEGSPLFAADLPNLIVTPHVAWAARESRQRSLDEIAANVADFLAGGRRGRVV